MGIRFKGLSAWGFGVQWEATGSDAALAQRLVYFLEDRRVLFGERHLEDEYQCVQSVLEIRRRVQEMLNEAKVGKQLQQSIRAMLAACRAFLTAAGPDGVRFRQGFLAGRGNDPFTRALTELRVMVGIQIGLIANYYSKIELSSELTSIVPDDGSGGEDWLSSRFSDDESPMR